MEIAPSDVGTFFVPLSGGVKGAVDVPVSQIGYLRGAERLQGIKLGLA